MDPVKVCYRKYFLHQKFYQTPKTKYIVYSPTKLMCTPSKCSISSFFTFSSHLWKSIKSSTVLKLFSNISFRWYQEISNIKTCKNICFVDMKNNLPYLKKALESSLPLIESLTLTFQKNMFFICFNDSPWKMMKNLFISC